MHKEIPNNRHLLQDILPHPWHPIEEEQRKDPSAHAESCHHGRDAREVRDVVVPDFELGGFVSVVVVLG